MGTIYSKIRVKWLDVEISADYYEDERVFDNIKGYIYVKNKGSITSKKSYMSRRLLEFYDDDIIDALSNQLIENDRAEYCMTF